VLWLCEASAVLLERPTAQLKGLPHAELRESAISLFPKHCVSRELTMSGINGDKSRFNRQRKQKIERRQRNRALLKHLAEKAKAPAAPAITPKERNA
jgi:hypothetical protein